MKILHFITLLGLSVGVFSELSAQSIVNENQNERPARTKNTVSQIPIDIIQDSRWRYRLLVFCSAGPNERSDFLRNLNPSNWDGYYERNIVFVHINQWEADAFLSFNSAFDNTDDFHIDVTGQAQQVLKLGECDLERNSVALIGKDGTLKKTWLTQPTEENIFQTIDSMPMRQQEMREQKEGQ